MPRTSRLAFMLALGLTTLAVAPRSVLANGRFPAANQLTATPGKPEALVLRTTFGLLFSSDQGKTWDWVCERAVGYGGVWDPPIGVFEDGAVMAGTIDGLALSPDRGCGWSYVGGPIQKRAIIDVVVRPDASREGLALASTSAGESDAGSALFKTEVLATTDAGRTWTAVSDAFDPELIAQTIEVASTDPARIYLSGTIGEEGVLFVSNDRGATFVRRTIALEKPDERAPFISAVSPTNPDRVYVRTSGGTSRLLVTDDAGVTFRTVFSGRPLAGFALSPDGTRVWLGSDAGLFGASATDLTFAPLSKDPVSCLFATDTTLYTCAGATTLPYALAASTDDGKTFTSVLALSNIRGPLACGATTSAAVCTDEWPAMRATLNPAPSRPDAGTVDAGARAAGPALGPYVASGGCSASTAAAKAGLGGLVFGLVSLIVLLRRSSVRRE